MRWALLKFSAHFFVIIYLEEAIVDFIFLAMVFARATATTVIACCLLARVGAGVMRVVLDLTCVEHGVPGLESAATWTSSNVRILHLCLRAIAVDAIVRGARFPCHLTGIEVMLVSELPYNHLEINGGRLLAHSTFAKMALSTLCDDAGIDALRVDLCE